MVRAILKNGDIQPLEPLPADWVEGQSLQIDALQRHAVDEPDPLAWHDELRRLAAMIPATDHQRMEEALDEQDQVAKENVRREMGA